MVAFSGEHLANITERLVAALRPERIYLFGSYAYGTPRADSDLDLLIIVPPNGAKTDDLQAAAYRAVESFKLPLDIIVRKADQFDRRSGWRANFEHTVRNKGRLLYGVDGMAFAKEWIEKAGRDRISAELLIKADPPLLDTAAFHCQQSVEKMLKGFLIHHNEPFEKLHDLVLLCRLCEKKDAEFGKLRESVATLNRFAVALRYPDEPNPTPKQVEEALLVVKEVCEFVMARLPEGLLEQTREE